MNEKEAEKYDQRTEREIIISAFSIVQTASEFMTGERRRDCASEVLMSAARMLQDLIDKDTPEDETVAEP